MSHRTTRLLIAASGTGGHLFPALAVAQRLTDCEIEWLGVPNRLEQTLIPEHYPLHAIDLEGFQTRLGFGTLRILRRFAASILQVKRLLVERNIQAVFTTGGYIAAPAILAARLQGLPVILHESNALPGKVTRWLAPFCTTVALGFKDAAKYLATSRTVWVGTPVRSSFLEPQTLDLPIPKTAPLIVVVGGSQGAVAVNQLVRQAAADWFDAGAYVVHLTGNCDPNADSLHHPQYFPLSFYENMAGLLQRATLAVSRAGAGTLAELAATQTPALLIPYPFAAEDHQTFNAREFEKLGAALLYPQEELTSQHLSDEVLRLLNAPDLLGEMRDRTAALMVRDSAERIAALL
ncbi:undecaprenyldiphospho-muramoylpentapeptide beta-N-acetylglucosaminyltransferase [Lusitaniella coriacea LEGE 07157]|uniref:UDP-N-acetylglucosamine--N-acetylmuramyl-(pentapeptide) pyrophosphoryl-undecaprenol N-acetylglucosamine transferase n=1 Tax=Lusitaniella coriacea LEGE 07157 TaxID=945747 RepID=A0A8J7B6J1_9CYAN|nr:undecaprenyldiphospho-muramoylpentapeptide beta-N-acetylglucosaminyltransferase [Lusitaniella coriacea]MBE9114454.1 undecaprenyldiphospho-muramoylpentapeptide beta-N-acetylglucosaminyltransferase [Lusitaniella coriacea LEGE 07157]